MVIGLTGFAGAGKSTVAQYLAKNHGFKRINFKDGLVNEMKTNFPGLLKEIKDVCQDLYMREYTVDSLFTEKPPIMRKFMQEYGTEVRRNDNQNYWVDKWRTSVVVEKLVVADDVRFFNELNAVRDMGGVIIRVERPDITSGGNHPSETEQLDFQVDFTIVGVPGSHAEIYQQVDSIIRTLKENCD